MPDPQTQTPLTANQGDAANSNALPSSLAPPLGSMTDEKKEYLKVLLEHNKTMSQGIYQRIDLQQKLLNFQLIFIGIVGAFAAKDPSILAGLNGIPLLVIIPLVLMLFIWGHLNHDMMIIAYSKYLHHFIHPEINRSVNSTLHPYECFLHEFRKKKTTILSNLGSEYILAFILSPITLAFLAGVISKNSGTLTFQIIPKINTEQLLYGILYTEIFLFIITIILRIAVTLEYSKITQRPTCLISPDHIPTHTPRKTWHLIEARVWLTNLMRRLTRS